MEIVLMGGARKKVRLENSSGNEIHISIDDENDHVWADISRDELKIAVTALETENK